MPWKKSLHPPDTDLKSLQPSNYGFLLIRPLYGSRDAPMRWFLKLSQILVAAGMRQLQSDVCFFTWHNHGNFEGLLLAHVDDLLFTGSTQFHSLVLTALKSLRTGELETLTETTPITFTGLLIETNATGAVILSQSPYIDELPKMDVESCISGATICNPTDLRSTFRQGIGALIWTHQTRPDIGFTITQLSTSSVSACKSPEGAREFCQRYNKVVKFMRNNQRKIHYTRLDKTLHGDAAVQQLMNYRIISFSDAGFASLAGSYSVEGNFLILGQVVSRDGVVHCHGGLIDHRCAKIHRVCRSSLSAETHAAITATDWALWFQVFLTEIFTQVFDVRRISPPTSFPLRNPFGESPSDAQINTEINLAGETFLMLNDYQQPHDWKEYQIVNLQCHRCQKSTEILIKSPTCGEMKMYHADNSRSNTKIILFKPLVLTDCCSLFSCVIKLQPTCLERCSRILIAYLRDLQSLITFSFIDGGTNLGDVNTKHAGSLTLLADYFRTGRFILSFIGRPKKT